MLLRVLLCVLFVVVRAMAVRGWTAPHTAASSRSGIGGHPMSSRVHQVASVPFVGAQQPRLEPREEASYLPAEAATPHNPIPAAVLAVSLGVLHALAPGAALAITAEDYDSMYKSSATANQPGFSFSLPKEPEKRKPAADETPSFALPKVPDFEAPKFEAPKFEAPKFEAPKFDAPKFDAPKFDAPKFDAPKFDAPSFPKVDAPKFDAPKVDLPKFDAPKVGLPPLFGTPETTAESATVEEEVDMEALLAQRAEIDERARETARDFREADADAKKVEAEGRKLRSLANDKKKVAAEAKDAACEYRPGGKWICLRGLNSGF